MRENFCSYRKMWFSVVCTLIDNGTHDHSGQNVVDSRGAAEWVHNKKSFQKLLQTRSTCRNNAKEMLGKRVMTSTLADKSTDHDKPHFYLFVFFTTISTSKQIFFSELELNWREQRGMDSYRQSQISQSDCEISYNCGKNPVLQLHLIIDSTINFLFFRIQKWQILNKKLTYLKRL